MNFKYNNHCLFSTISRMNYSDHLLIRLSVKSAIAKLSFEKPITLPKNNNQPKKHTWAGIVTFTRIVAGAPNDCFLYNICSEKQTLPEIFYYLRTATNF